MLYCVSVSFTDEKILRRTRYTEYTMIGTLTGKAEDAGKGIILIKTDSGVGYIAGVSATTKNTALQEETCTLFTHTVIRKDTMELFGFLEQEEYSAFLLLLTVSGIGPKKALVVTERVPVPALLQAIKKEDVDTLVSFGITKKEAQRITLELQRKIEMSENDIPAAGDVVPALVALGYDKKEIAEALKNTVLKGKTTEEQIQETLRAMRNMTLQTYGK